MTYNPSIPQSSDDPSVSQAQLLTNFGQINTAISRDHVTLTDATNNGLHKKVTFNEIQGADPGETYPKTAFYPKERTVGGDDIPQLFYESNTSLGVSQVIPISMLALLHYEVGTSTKRKEVNIGTVNNPSVGTFQVNFTKDMPDNFYVPLCSAESGGNEVKIDTRISSATQVTLVFVDSSNNGVNPTRFYLVVWGF